MGAVYDRILKLTPADQSGDTHINLMYMAVLNLTVEQDITDFITDYKKCYPSEYKNTICFVLEYLDPSYRKPWNNAMKNVVVGTVNTGNKIVVNGKLVNETLDVYESFNVDLSCMRSDKKLATQFTWINGKNEVIEFPNKPVQQQGKHQNILSPGFTKAK